MANRGSRKGIGVDRSDYDRVTAAFHSAGIQFEESVIKPRRYDPAFPFTGRRAMTILLFETTTLYFDAKGRYVGREYMSRDECDCFNPRETGRAE